MGLIIKDGQSAPTRRVINSQWIVVKTIRYTRRCIETFIFGPFPTASEAEAWVLTHAYLEGVKWEIQPIQKPYSPSGLRNG